MLSRVDLNAVTAKVRLLADARESQFLTDEEIQRLIDDSLNELYNDILELKTGLFLKTVDDLAPVEGNKIIFPTDFYKVRLLEHKWSAGDHIPVLEKTLEEVSAFTGSYFVGNYLIPSVYGYVLFDDHLKLYPEEGASGFRFRLHYGKDINLSATPIRTEMIKYLGYQSAYIHSVIEQNPNDRLKVLAESWRNGIMKWFATRDESPKVIRDLENSYPQMVI